MEGGGAVSQIVTKWPTVLHTDAGIVCNPTPEQCRAAGFELAVPPTPEEFAAQAAQAAEAAAAQERMASLLAAYVDALRTAYRDACNQFCVLAGLPVVNKFEDASTVMAAIEAANAGEDTMKALKLTQLALRLDNLITELRRKDGDDAWERI